MIECVDGDMREQFRVGTRVDVGEDLLEGLAADAIVRLLHSVDTDPNDVGIHLDRMRSVGGHTNSDEPLLGF